MSQFLVAQMCMTVINGRTYVVDPEEVFRIGTRHFSFDSADPTLGNPGGPVLPIGVSPFSLSPSPSTLVGGNHKSTLSFAIAKAAAWQEVFEAEQRLLFDMQVQGKDNEILTVELYYEEVSARAIKTLKADFKLCVQRTADIALIKAWRFVRGLVPRLSEKAVKERPDWKPSGPEDVPTPPGTPGQPAGQLVVVNGAPRTEGAAPP